MRRTARSSEVGDDGVMNASLPVQRDIAGELLLSVHRGRGGQELRDLPWTELVGSATAVFGREPDHRTQFVSLASILDGGTSLVCVERIDLRIPDTPIIDRGAACMTAALELS